MEAGFQLWLSPQILIPWLSSRRFSGPDAGFPQPRPPPRANVARRGPRRPRRQKRLPRERRLRGAGDLTTTYVVAFVLLLLLYPACRWYRTFKAAHPDSFLKYL